MVHCERGLDPGIEDGSLESSGYFDGLDKTIVEIPIFLNDLTHSLELFFHPGKRLLEPFINCLFEYVHADCTMKPLRTASLAESTQRKVIDPR